MTDINETSEALKRLVCFAATQHEVAAFAERDLETGHYCPMTESSRKRTSSRAVRNGSEGFVTEDRTVTALVTFADGTAWNVRIEVSGITGESIDAISVRQAVVA